MQMEIIKQMDTKQLILTKLQHMVWAAGNVMLIVLIFVKNVATKKSVNQTKKFVSSKLGLFSKSYQNIKMDDI